jgi:hypothetical protein
MNDIDIYTLLSTHHLWVNRQTNHSSHALFISHCKASWLLFPHWLITNHIRVLYNKVISMQIKMIGGDERVTITYRSSMINAIYSQTCPCVHLYLAVTCIKSLPFSCPVIYNFILIEPVLRGYLSYNATFSLSQRWPFNTGLTVYIHVYME